MTKLIMKIGLLCFLTLPCLSLGCGDSGGEAGDSNDPAATGDDEAQMQDETGDVGPENAE